MSEFLELEYWTYRIDLFRWALLAALVAGLVCPLIGVFLHLRRTSFHGIALPQFATAGAVFSFVFSAWIERAGMGELHVEGAHGVSHTEMVPHLLWAAAFTFGALLALARMGRRGGSETGRIAAAFAIATAATILFGKLSADGKSFADELLVGELNGVGFHEFDTLAAVYAVVLCAVLWFHRDLTMVSFDRESALVLGLRVGMVEALFGIATGLTVAVGTMFLGPTLLFGLVVVPAVAARPLARSMSSYLWLASALGVASVPVGFVISIVLDLPLGATIVAASALALVPAAWTGARRA